MARPFRAARTILLACLTTTGVAQRLRPAHPPHPIAAAGASYYVASSGSDTNDGRSPDRAWKTVGMVNRSLAELDPCDRVLFHRGDVFRDDFLRLVNQVNATSATTLATDPPKYSGTGACQFTIGAYGNGPAPLLDGADPLSLRWTRVAGNTYSAPLPNPPAKLYVDPPSAATCATSACPALLPVPNAVSGAGPYHFLDLVMTPQGARYVIYGANTAAQAPSGQGFGYAYLWRLIRTTPAPGVYAQIFSTTGTGLQNVQGTPNSWYYDSNTHLVYVNLRDGSNPSAHRFAGSYRAFGVVLQSVNHVTVTGLAVAHVSEDCLLASAYSDSNRGGSYFTNEGNQIVGNQCWNYGSLVTARDPQQTHVNPAVAGILVVASGDANPHLLRGNAVTGNNVGTADGYMGASITDGIAMYNQDGGGKANTLEAAHNIVHTTLGRALVYSGVYPLNNNGGRIAYNEAFDNQGNFFFGSTTGGRADHNYAHESYGEGIQIGGTSKSDGNGADLHLLDHNLLVNLGKTSNGTAFNGIDCNTGGSDDRPGGSLDGVWEVNNTMFNTNSAGPTFEPGCVRPHFYNNIVDQNYHMFPFDQTSVPNHSYLIYFTPGTFTTGFDFGHNLWTPGTNLAPFRNKFDCNGWLSSVETKNSACVPDPGFTNVQAGDFSLRPGAPAIGYGQVGVAGVGTADAGAIPFGQSKLF